MLVPEAIVLNRIARRYRIRGFNEVIAKKEYLPTGLSGEARRRPADAAAPRVLLLQELLAMGKGRRLPVGVRVRAYANLTRYGLHDARGLRGLARLAPDRRLWAATLPVGGALYLRDRMRDSV